MNRPEFAGLGTEFELNMGPGLSRKLGLCKEASSSTTNEQPSILGASSWNEKPPSDVALWISGVSENRDAGDGVADIKSDSQILILSDAGVERGEASSSIVKSSVYGGLIMSMYSGNGITGEGV